MARVRHLPIYNETYNLLKCVTKYTQNFPKAYKYSLGEKLRDETIELVTYVYKANSKKKKSDFIEIILERVEILHLLLRLCKDMHLFSVKQFSEIVSHSDSISRQAQGWLNHAKS